MEKFKNRKEQREVIETMDKVLLPLLEYLNAETAIKIRRGLYLLSKIDVEPQESERDKSTIEDAIIKEAEEYEADFN